jgi:hypothetical protein
MPKKNPEYLFVQKTQYFNSPQGCLRLLRIDGAEFVGARFSRVYRVPLAEATPVVRRSLREEGMG